MEEKINSADLLEEVRVAIKEILVATVRKRDDELILKFPNGQSFTLTLWENKR